MVAALAALLVGAPAASADIEPNDGIVQPEGPIAGGVAYTGALASPNDDDWYVFYAASQTQLDISLTSTGPCSAEAELLTTDGFGIDSAFAPSNTTDHILYTTPAGTQRYLFVVDYTSCVGSTYSFRLDPGAAILPGPSLLPAQATGEPNENAGQAFGPLAGGASYAASVDTQNDQDWFYFYTSGTTPFDLSMTRLKGGCTPFAELRRDGSDTVIDSMGPGEDRADHIVLTPSGPQKYLLGVEASCAGAAYRLQLDPAAAISLLAPPPPAPPPAPPVARAPSRRCTSARAGVVRWRSAIRRTRAKLQVVETRRARRLLRRKLGAQRRTLRRAKDRVTIYC